MRWYLGSVWKAPLKQQLCLWWWLWPPGVHLFLHFLCPVFCSALSLPFVSHPTSQHIIQKSNAFLPSPTPFHKLKPWELYLMAPHVINLINHSSASIVSSRISHFYQVQVVFPSPPLPAPWNPPSVAHVMELKFISVHSTACASIYCCLTFYKSDFSNCSDTNSEKCIWRFHSFSHLNNTGAQEYILLRKSSVVYKTWETLNMT